MATTVRLDAETEQLIRRLRRCRATTRSEVIREAIRQLASRELRGEEARRPYDAVKRLIGSVDSGGMHLSKGTGQQVATLLAGRTRPRRSR
jgi:Arc/MetJ-type ribon-helix-helix transcriptional regulator